MPDGSAVEVPSVRQLAAFKSPTNGMRFVQLGLLEALMANHTPPDACFRGIPAATRETGSVSAVYG